MVDYLLGGIFRLPGNTRVPDLTANRLVRFFTQTACSAHYFGFYIFLAWGCTAIRTVFGRLFLLGETLAKLFVLFEQALIGTGKIAYLSVQTIYALA